MIPVLFEYKRSRKELSLLVSMVCCRMEQGFQVMGVSGTTVTLSVVKADDDNPFFSDGAANREPLSM